MIMRDLMVANGAFTILNCAASRLWNLPQTVTGSSTPHGKFNGWGTWNASVAVWSWPLVYAYGLLDVLYFKLCGHKVAEDLAVLAGFRSGENRMNKNRCNEKVYFSWLVERY